jgi:hypothetical protein
VSTDTVVSFAWYDAVGLVGVVLILVAYLLLQTERMRSDAVTYSVLNGVGAALVLWSLFYAWNLSAVVIETAWLLISVYGLIKARRKRASR